MRPVIPIYNLMQAKFFNPWIALLFLLATGSQLSAQIKFESSNFLDARIFVDTLEFNWRHDVITTGGKKQLSFRYTEENQVAEVYLFFDEAAPVNDVQLLPSADFSLLDSVFIFTDYVRFKVRFNNLTTTEFLKFTMKVWVEAREMHPGDSVGYDIVDLPLFPFTDTYAELYPNTDELYIGEEKVFELTTNNPENIIIDNRWTEGLPINYRTTRNGSNLMLHLLPNALGTQQLVVPFQVKKPSIQYGRPTYELPPVQQSFTIKSGRLVFLQFDKQEVTPHEDKTEPIEVQIDNSRFLRIGKTYRIENQEEAGGPLIAELFTKTRLNNDRILCLLRPYAFHRKADGYLYIKDGDEPRFVTNLDITPRTTIENIFIQREGRDWASGNTVYPGETINIRLEGKGLHKAKFSFPGANNLEFDSLVRNENISLYRIKVPLDITANKIEIFNHNQSTGKSLNIREYQKPRVFDFVTLDLGSRRYKFSEVEKPIYYDETLTDLVFDFDRNAIDNSEDIHGKQYLSIKVKVSGKRGNLIELYQFDQVIVCPGEASPRFTYYDKQDCRSEDINLNNFLARKTSELEEWSRIELEVAHRKDKYGEEGNTKRVQIYLKRDYNFDIDVSFPAGLLILKKDNKDFTNFGGVSFAMLAQFSFYQPGKIAKYRPYKFGAGFIAIDAFNFTSNNERQDVGLVVIGSLYPTSSNNRLSFPLFMGGGYLLKEKKPFFLIGPGIQVRM